MVAISSLSSSNLSAVRSTETLATRSAKPGSTAAATPTRESLNAKQGAEAVDKAATNATKAFAALDSLRQDLAAATKPGANLGQDEIKALNDRVTAVKAQIDRLSSDAKVGDSNLLSNKASSVAVSTASGDQIRVAAQPLDSKALGLDDLAITDTDSLRKAAGKIALATGQTQNSVFNLQAANGALAPQQSNPGIEAFEKIRAARDAAPAAGSAAAAVEQALNNQASVNTYGYGRSGRAAAGKNGSILDLFA